MYRRKSHRTPVIGLTGPSGAGKGAACACFAEHGIKSIDTDAVYHRLLKPPSKCFDELTQYFGKEIISDSGEIDRKKLSAIVFKPGNGQELEMLNKISHKHILKKTIEILDKNEKDGVLASIVDAPLLFESEFHLYCDINISVIAPFDVRLQRVILRDNIPIEKAIERLKAQKSDGYYISRSDYTIVNDSDITNLRKQVDEIVSIIFKK